MKTTIVTGVYNEIWSFKLFYYSLRKRTPKGQFSLLVVDDQSTNSDLLSFLDVIGKEPDVTVVHDSVFVDDTMVPDETLFDYVVQEFEINTEHIVFAHTDIEFLDDKWLDKAIRPVESDARCIGSVIIDSGGELGVVRNGWLPESHESFERKDMFIYSPRIASWFAFFHLPTFRALGLKWKRDYSERLFADRVRSFDDVGFNILHFLCTNEDGYYVSILDESIVHHRWNMSANAKMLEKGWTKKWLISPELWEQQQRAKIDEIKERLTRIYGIQQD